MTEPEAPVREGQILAGKYRVEKVLGVGGMGVVVAATHTELDQRVALKFLLPSAAMNPDVVARFAREARAAAKIKSEHVARVSDVGTLDDGLPYIVMEFLDGGDLSELLLKRGRLPIAEAVDYVLEACDAIAEAHAGGIIHRDLKPANLFLARQQDGTDKIKVLDFGISKATGTDASRTDASLTRTSDVFGSPMYMSPEQLRSSRDVDARSDIWALGVILFEIVTGKAPFERGTVAEIFGAILHESPQRLRELLPDAPEGLDRALARCLEKDAAKRFPHVGEFAKALVPFGSGSAKKSADRVARVLRRAGVAVDSVPPGALESGPSSLGPSSVSVVPRMTPASAVTSLAPSPAPVGSATKSAWGASGTAPKPRSSARRAGIVIAALVVAGIGVIGFTRLRPRPVPMIAATAEPPPLPAITAPPAQPPIVTAPVVPAVLASVAPTSSAASGVPSGAASVAPAKSGNPAAGKPKPGAKASPGPRAGDAKPDPGAMSDLPGVPPPQPPAPPPAPPPKKASPDDPEGFGDRH